MIVYQTIGMLCHDAVVPYKPFYDIVFMGFDVGQWQIAKTFCAKRVFAYHEPFATNAAEAWEKGVE